MEPTDPTAAPKLPTQQPPTAAPPTALGRGRRRILNETKCEEVCYLVSAGCGIEDAARHVGCVPKTILREARRNPNFGLALQDAQIEAEITPLNAMRAAAKQNWRAAAWLLERTNPQRFTRLKIDTVRPDELQSLADFMSSTIATEVSDQDVRNYLIGRLRYFVEQLHRDARLRTRKYQEIKPITNTLGSPRHLRQAANRQLQNDTKNDDAHTKP